MDIEASSGPYQDLDVQALAVAVFKDEKADQGLLKELDAKTGGMASAASTPPLKLLKWLGPRPARCVAKT
jgi:hypothetical protein